MKTLLVILVSVFAFINTAQAVEYGERVKIDSKEMAQQRDIFVVLPESYAGSPKREYPVIYLMHGQWDTLAATATLNLLGRDVPEMIIIGVQGSGGELFPAKDGKQSKFSRFLHLELLDYVKSNYRSNGYNILSGHSNSGRFVFEDWLAYGNDFNRYFSFSLSLNGKEKQRLENMELDKLAERAPIIITMASENERSQSAFSALEDALPPAANGFPKYKRFPDQTHSSTRHASLRFALLDTFRNWKPSEEVENGLLEPLKKHYQDLSDTVGFKVDVPIETLRRIAAFGSISEDLARIKNAEDVIAFVLKNDASKADELASAADDVISFFNSQLGSDRIIKQLCLHVPSHARCKA